MAIDPEQEHPESEEPDQEGLFDAQMSLPLPFLEAPEPFSTVRKRNGREESFERAKIANAIFRAAQSIGGADRDLADSLARAVTIYLTKQLGSHVPTVDHIHENRMSALAWDIQVLRRSPAARTLETHRKITVSCTRSATEEFKDFLAKNFRCKVTGRQVIMT